MIYSNLSKVLEIEIKIYVVFHLELKLKINRVKAKPWGAYKSSK